MTKRILLVEDEPNIIEAIRFILSRDGWQVSTHSDGTSAMEAIARVKPDVLLLDVMLPGRSGFEILRELREDDGTATLPVLMLTAKGQGRDREQAERYGVTRFMTKPFANADVLEAVNAMAADLDAASDARESTRNHGASGPTAPGQASPGHAVRDANAPDPQVADPETADPGSTSRS